MSCGTAAFCKQWIGGERMNERNRNENGKWRAEVGGRGFFFFRWPGRPSKHKKNEFERGNRRRKNSLSFTSHAGFFSFVFTRAKE